MNRQKIIRWLAHQNEQVCLRLSATYYRKREKGSGPYYFLHPRFWLLLFFRALTGTAQFLRFNREVQAHFNFAARNPETGMFSFKEFILSVAGLRHFIKPAFTPVFYAEQKIVFKTGPSPLVSIIVPVYNQLAFTLLCLKSLSRHLPEDIPVEVIVADDLSNDHTQQTLSEIPGLVYIRNTENLGFLKNCNNAMRQAKGAYIALLNNDTIIQPGWLENLLKALISDEGAGCAGSKLIYPYGLLQEAGGVIFDDGSGINYGKFAHPEKHLYNFNRPVDYCSGASFLFKKADIEELGYFDEQFCPAYYEDTDICFAFRHILNKKVVYTATSVVVHFEGVSSGKRAKKGNVKRYQEINRGKFHAKWKHTLSPVSDVDAAARRFLPPVTILAVDTNLPLFDRDSGSNRMLHLVNIFQATHHHVIFLPKDGLTPQPYFDLLINNGVEVIQNYLGRGYRRRELVKMLPLINIAWLCRPRINKDFAFIFRKRPAIKWVYDTVDLHYVRLQREADLLPHGDKRKKLSARSQRYFRLETQLARRADKTIAITAVEEQALAAQGITNCCVVPNIHLLKNKGEDNPKQRSGVLFIGNFKHQPNEDAVMWLLDEIMPAVWKSLPETHLTIVGANAGAGLMNKTSSNVTVTGFVKDVDPYFNQSRVFIAPLRYGAGMKGKIGQALEYALPIVSTSIGTEGMDLINKFNVIEADTTAGFAQGVIALLEDDALWTRLAQNSAAALAPFSFEVQQQNVRKLLDELTN